MRIVFFILFFCFATVSLAAYAPVYEANIVEKIPQDGKHTVAPGETFYSIAWRYGLDYRQLARQNEMGPPYHIEAGDVIYLKGFAPIRRVSRPAVLPIQKNFLKTNTENFAKVLRWTWPAIGIVIKQYSSSNRGINIAGYVGQPIYAAASGKVVYSGNGLKSYGNLILLKHNGTYLTAYALNKQNLVKEGDWVKAGQKIALMGESGSKRGTLHFQIRRNGKPVNPMKYLYSP